MKHESRIMNKKITILENEELVLPVVWTGAEKDFSFNISLNGKGASVTLLLLLLGRMENSVRINANIYHNMPETKSRVIVKGVLNDSSSVDFDGLVKIEKGSKGSNAWLSTHLMLLSKEAAGRAVPSLEILENDIKAGHAVTVGRVDDKEMFYLMSRGLSKKQSKQLIIQGFLSRFLDEFPEGKTKFNAMKALNLES